MPTPLLNTPWHTLSLTRPIRSAPPLLVQSIFTPTSYTLYLTDLTSVWSETLSKREILSRAGKEGTTIDPSGDLSQLKILLEKLQHAVVKQDDDVDLELTSAPARGEGVLKLKTTTELPAPLRPLIWVFRLQSLPRVQYTNLFVLPLIGCISTLQDQIESLLSIVKDKDNLIERLTDQLKEHNLDVKNMLGGGRARRRGLEIFDEETWRADYGGEGERRVGEVIKDVFSGNGLREVGGGVRGLGEVEDWWKSVDDGSDGDDDGGEKEVKEEKVVVRKSGEKKIVEKIRDKGPVRGAKNERMDPDDEDEFQVQKTPPRKFAQPFSKKSPSPVPAPPAADDDHTASDSDDLDLPPPRKFVPNAAVGRPTSSLPPKPKSVDAVPTKPVSKKDDSPKIPGSLSPLPPTRPPDVEMSDIAAVAGEETEDSDTVVVPRMPRRSKGKEPAAAQLSRDISPPPKLLGKESVKTVIGDKKSSASASASPPPPPPCDSKDEAPVKEAAKLSPAPIKKAIGRIGKIGGKKVVKREDDDDAKMEDAVGKPKLPTSPSNSARIISPQPPEPPVKAKTPEPEPEEEEDEDEKADRKRRQLEKELEAKKKAPAKKKRKF
ncbi:hypothetical protein Q9L58_005304 [Maublancomyces gigas]|uniref:Non-homologous end-joining factor 1 n=1 Tax=Discina gigas TaxID=1032678 RepID=A0ABR3GJQ4_9PEZI